MDGWCSGSAQAGSVPSSAAYAPGAAAAYGDDEYWVVVPHVGCSHQHSRYVLAVFADKEVTLEGELQPWSKRVVSSAWTKLCSAPRGIPGCPANGRALEAAPGPGNIRGIPGWSHSVCGRCGTC